MLVTELGDPTGCLGEARAWDLHTHAGRVRVGVTAEGQAFAATVAYDLLSSPTNGVPKETTLFAWPMRVGEPIRASVSDVAREHWRLVAAFFRASDSRTGWNVARLDGHGHRAA